MMSDRAFRIIARVIGELRDVRTGISKAACDVLADELEIALKIDIPPPGEAKALAVP